MYIFYRGYKGVCAEEGLLRIYKILHVNFTLYEGGGGPLVAHRLDHRSAWVEWLRASGLVWPRRLRGFSIPLHSGEPTFPDELSAHANLRVQGTYVHTRPRANDR